MKHVCVGSGGRAGYDQGGGASSVQLQVHHLLLRPATAAALLQRIREDGQTATHLGADVHVRGGDADLNVRFTFSDV